MKSKIMVKKENQSENQSFSESVELEIQKTLTKGKEKKVGSEPKPKSGKGL